VEAGAAGGLVLAVEGLVALADEVCGVVAAPPADDRVRRDEPPLSASGTAMPAAITASRIAVPAMNIRRRRSDSADSGLGIDGEATRAERSRLIEATRMVCGGMDAGAKTHRRVTAHRRLGLMISIALLAAAVGAGAAQAYVVRGRMAGGTASCPPPALRDLTPWGRRCNIR